MKFMHKPTIPLSLYIHIPWCIRKCPYCDFNSYAKGEDIPQEAYVTALLTDLQHDLHLVQNRSLKSIFFGGGTPSLFSAQSIEQILTGVQKQLPFDSDIEITLEANPGTVEYTPFKDYRSAGVNRISVGAQSFQNDKLKVLGRIHQANEIHKAIDAIQNSDFNSFNIDLMYGLPLQTVEDALFDLETALSFSPPHLSWYNLTLEPNTVFHRSPPVLPDEELLWDIQKNGIDYLTQHSLIQYEISAFSTHQNQCRHNLNYWEFGDYLGIGAGAHAKITTANGILRYSKKRFPKSYLEATTTFMANSRILTPIELPFEFMLNGLRLFSGISFQLFEERTGLSITKIEKPLKEALAKRLIHIENEVIIPTELGKRFLNDLMAIFLPETISPK
jgi:putative oxygen-independent coproporphyrinogen III oxidase